MYRGKKVRLPYWSNVKYIHKKDDKILTDKGQEFIPTGPQLTEGEWEIVEGEKEMNESIDVIVAGCILITVLSCIITAWALLV